MGANLGTVAFEVVSVTPLAGSSSSLPEVEVLILNADELCEDPLTLFEDAPEPMTSSEPFEGTATGGSVTAHVNGLDITIATTNGESGATVAANLAAAIGAATGLETLVTGASFAVASVDPALFVVTINDAGLAAASIPALGPLALGLLAIGIAGITARRLRAGRERTW